MKKYDWDGKEYKKYSEGQHQWGQELISKLFLKGNESVLDIGCGDGKLTAEISLELPQGFVIGIDNSESMVEFARKVYPKNQYLNLSFETADAKNLLFKNKFDVIFSNAALHWVDDHKKVLEGIYDALKSGGRIIIQLGGKGNASAAFEVLEKIKKLKKWSKFFIGFQTPYFFQSDDIYKKYLLDAGLNPVRVELIEKDMVHHGLEGFKGFIRTTWLPFTQKVPVNIREDFISETADLFIKTNPPDQNGKIHIKMVRLEVEAVKEEN